MAAALRCFMSLTIAQVRFSFGGLEQQVKMIRHQYPTDKPEAKLGSSCLDRLDKERTIGGINEEG
jgi:hypothetical protein